LAILGDLAIPSTSVHDIGKVSPGFQLKYFRDALIKQISDLNDKPAGHFLTNHAHIGACALWANINKEDPFQCPTVAQIAAMHHGSVRIEPLPTDSGELLGGVAWSKERKNLIKKMETEYGTLNFHVPSLVQRDFISGMVTISDWIGSDESFFPPAGLPPNVHINTAAQTAVSACGLIKPTIIPELSFEEIFEFSPYDIQKQFGAGILNYGKPGVFVLEAPMGMGKTEAALYAAYLLMASGQNSGFFFGLPTRLTSNRIHERIDPFLKKICEDKTGAKLAHGTAWLKAFWHSSFEKGGGGFKPGNSWFNPRKRALLHPFVVGTVDQALMSALRVKHHFVRTFGLAGKVVILDEVHSYDGYTGTLIETMASQLTQIGCSVIILSATLTGKRRSAFFKKNQPAKDVQSLISQTLNKSSDTESSTPYPLISGSEFTLTSPPLKGQKYKIHIGEVSNLEMAKQAIDKALQNQCVLCIANTVATAQAWFDAISAEMPDGAFPIGLLHSKFPGFQRAAIEDLWMSRLGKPPKYGHKDLRLNGCILVATQVVEQSVDIDADYLITELAPTDMLLQRMGRQFRHDRKNRPCTIPETLILCGNPDHSDSLDQVLEAFGRSNCHVYAPWVLWRTRDVWKKQDSVTIPDDIRTLLEATYEESSRQCSKKAHLMDELHTQFVQHKNALADKAMGNLSTATAMPVGEDNETCATRYSDLPTTQVLLVKDINSTGNEAQLTLLNEARVMVNAARPDPAVTAQLHLNLVTIPSWLLLRYGSLKTPIFLKKHFFETTPILLWNDNSGEIILNGRLTDFRYTPLKGLFRRSIPESPGSNAPHEKNNDNDATVYLTDFESMDPFDKSKFDW
jgi:CRISPR-associated endonuclease/helicase Cas3